jgi:hypothetical protein
MQSATQNHDIGIEPLPFQSDGAGRLAHGRDAGGRQNAGPGFGRIVGRDTGTGNTQRGLEEPV